MKKPIFGHKNQRLMLQAISSSGKIPHAFIFTGPAGIGKKMIARRFLSALFCEDAQKPCGVCHSCAQIGAGTHPDFLHLSPNDNGIIPVGEDGDDIGSMRHLISRVSVKPVTGRAAVIVDGIDRASTEAQNAFLKTLEEPVEGYCIIIIASDRSRVLQTIFSRCRDIRFSPLSDSDMDKIIADKCDSEDTADFIKAGANGSAETAVSLCEDSYRDTILSLCRSLSSAIRSGSSFVPPSQSLAKPKSGADPLDIMANIYASLLRENASDSSRYSSLLNDIYIDDSQALRTIIKILVSAKKSRSNNVNAPLLLKALTYHAFDRTDIVPPFASGLNFD